MSQPVVLITGAARGLGRALAEACRARGWQVLAPGRDALDVSDEASIHAYAARLADQPIDILCNNAGVRLDDGTGAMTQADWLRTLTVNTVGPALVTRALLPALRRGRQRKILFMSSRLGSFGAGTGTNSGGGDGSYAAYRASKTALNQVARCLASDLAGEGFTCVAISPGWVRTDMGGTQASDTPEAVAADILDLAGAIVPAQNGSFLDRKGISLPW